MEVGSQNARTRTLVRGLLGGAMPIHAYVCEAICLCACVSVCVIYYVLQLTVFASLDSACGHLHRPERKQSPKE